MIPPASIDRIQVVSGEESRPCDHSSLGVETVAAVAICSNRNTGSPLPAKTVASPASRRARSADDRESTCTTTYSSPPGPGLYDTERIGASCPQSSCTSIQDCPGKYACARPHTARCEDPTPRGDAGSSTTLWHSFTTVPTWTGVSQNGERIRSTAGSARNGGAIAVELLTRPGASHPGVGSA